MENLQQSVRFFSIDFELDGETYYALIRSMFLKGNTQYRLTVMNRDLERRLCGHKILTEFEGRLIAKEQPVPESAQKILTAIINSFEKQRTN